MSYSRHLLRRKCFEVRSLLWLPWKSTAKIFKSCYFIRHCMIRFDWWIYIGQWHESCKKSVLKAQKAHYNILAQLSPVQLINLCRKEKYRNSSCEYLQLLENICLPMFSSLPEVVFWKYESFITVQSNLW